ncbi:MAG TPA: hypothetical protein VMY88_02555 [Acidimicrobiales bacterium]|nr:hypothetical protein [Acidimicrobiales bacterium]
MARRILLTVVTVVAFLGFAAPAAGAHGIQGVESTNYRTRITGMTPRRDGLIIRVVEAGSRLELINRTDEDVVIFGYQDEPYLRIDAAGGVFANVRSPATYINADRSGSRQPPPDADPSAPPEWERIDDGLTARWHDHRAHWMGTKDAPPVRRSPGERHVVIPRWEVPIEVRGERVLVTGDLTWIPGTSSVPWLALSIAIALGIAGTAFTRRGVRALTLIVVLVVLVDMVHVAGKASAAAGGLAAGAGGVLSGSFFSLAGWAAGGLAVVLLLRRSDDGPFAAAFAGAVVALFGGLADIADLSRSQIPFAFGELVARMIVSWSLGAGAGLVLAAILRFRRNPAPKPAQGAFGDGGEGGEPVVP